MCSSLVIFWQFSALISTVCTYSSFTHSLQTFHWSSLSKVERYRNISTNLTFQHHIYSTSTSTSPPLQLHTTNSTPLPQHHYYLNTTTSTAPLPLQHQFYKCGHKNNTTTIYCYNKPITTTFAITNTLVCIHSCCHTYIPLSSSLQRTA